MEPVIFQNYPESQRERLLSDNADEVKDGSYLKRLTSDELAAAKESLAEHDILIDEFEREKKEFMDALKERMSPVVQARKIYLDKVRDKTERVRGNLYKIIDHETRMVGFYDKDGNLIEARPMLASEAQTTIYSINRRTGTND